MCVYGYHEKYGILCDSYSPQGLPVLSSFHYMKPKAMSSRASVDEKGETTPITIPESKKRKEKQADDRLIILHKCGFGILRAGSTSAGSTWSTEHYFLVLP